LCRWLGHGQKEDELDGPTNFKPLIDGLLITKAVSQKQNRWFTSLNQLLLMADQGIVVSSCGTIAG
jgi:hypothetical protein